MPESNNDEGSTTDSEIKDHMSRN